VPKQETQQTKSGFDCMKQLSEYSRKDSPITGLITAVSACRKKLEEVLVVERERERNISRARKEEKKRFEEEKKTKAESAQKNTAQVNAAGDSFGAGKTATDNKAEEQAQEKDKGAVAKVSNTSSPKIPIPQKDNIQTRSFDVGAPSYIRGRISPSQAAAARANSRPDPKSRAAANAARNTNAANQQANKTPAPLRSTQGAALSVNVSKDRAKIFGPDKKKETTYRPSYDDKRGMSKRTLIRKGFMVEAIDEERANVRKLKNKKKIDHIMAAPIKIEKATITTENLTVKILSEKIGKTATEIIKQLMILGIMATVNDVVDFPTMELVANEFGIELELKLEQSKEEILIAGHDVADTEESLKARPPVITVMGHVDHGKTSLLDYIKKTNVVEGESGGITQHIGAYSVTVGDKKSTKKITFLDTPGHEAFMQMRARGAQVTDIAVLVVAADDGIMPQTIEAIKHAEEAKVPVVVAINKIDKPGANVDKVIQMLGEYNLVSEAWGGDTMMVPISAKTGQGIDKLQESILLLAEVNNYRANPERLAKAVVLEARLDKGRGPVANVLVHNGTLRVGDYVVSGTAVGHVRAMTDDLGRNVKEAGPSMPVTVLGFKDVPMAGDSLLGVTDEKIAKQVAGERTAKMRIEQASLTQKITLEDVLKKTGSVKLKDVNVIIKADTQGSAEALKSSLSQLANEEAKINIVRCDVGSITQADIMMAEISNSIIVGFHVRGEPEVKKQAEKSKIEIRSYRVIYEAIEDLTKKLTSMLTPKYREVITGKAEVRNVFKVTGSGIIAGSYVQAGKIYRNCKVRVFRNSDIVFDGSLKGLKRFKEDVKEVAEGFECGISVEGYSDIKELDIIEAYQLELIS